jgi:hypothetical protein
MRPAALAMLGSLSTTAGALAPPLRTPAAVHAFLEGRWRVVKSLDYEIPAGWRGAMTGEVVVRPRPSQPSVLMWSETGQMRLDSQPASEISTHKHLAIRCPDQWPVSVFFVDGEPAAATDDGWGVAPTQGLFVELRPQEGDEEGEGSALSFAFDHLCVKDLYTGAMVFDGKDSFRWDWRIVGPNKDGLISQKYERIRS